MDDIKCFLMEKLVRLFSNSEDALIGMTILKNFSIDQIIKFIENFRSANHRFESYTFKNFKVKYSGHLCIDLNIYIGFEKDEFIVLIDSNTIVLCEKDSAYLEYKKYITWI